MHWHTPSPSGYSGLLHDERSLVLAPREARARADTVEREIEVRAPAGFDVGAGCVGHPASLARGTAPTLAAASSRPLRCPRGGHSRLEPDALMLRRSVAVSVISGTLASAFDSGQKFFAAAASSWNFASSMPGITASSVNAM